MLQKLNILDFLSVNKSSLDISKLPNAVIAATNEVSRRIENKAIKVISDVINKEGRKWENQYYVFVADLIKKMRNEDESEDANLETTILGEDLPTLGRYTWKALKPRTIKRKYKKGRRGKKGFYYDTGSLYKYLMGSKYSGYYNRTIPTTGIAKVNKTRTKLFYQSALRYSRPRLPKSQEYKLTGPLYLGKYDYEIGSFLYETNESVRPLMEPMRFAFINDLLPRKLRNALLNANNRDKMYDEIFRSLTVSQAKSDNLNKSKNFVNTRTIMTNAVKWNGKDLSYDPDLG